MSTGPKDIKSRLHDILKTEKISVTQNEMMIKNSNFEILTLNTCVPF